MHFILRVYRNRQTESAVEKDLREMAVESAPSVPANRIVQRSGPHFGLLLYLYDIPWNEKSEEHLAMTPSGIDLLIGSVENSGRNPVGDYIHFSLSAGGNGFIRRPQMSFLQLFFCETDTYVTFASEVSLILLMEVRLRKKYLKNIFDRDFIYEAIMREWQPRNELHRTFIRTVRRAFPHYHFVFSNGSMRYISRQYCPCSCDLKSMYLSNRAAFYHRVIEDLVLHARRLLEPLRHQKVAAQITGGLDSRNNLALLLLHRKNLSLEIELQVSGPINHPDVQVAMQIAKSLDLPIRHYDFTDERIHEDYPKSVSDYQRCFRLNQGDVTSNNFRTSLNLPKVPTIFGTDNYKRGNIQSAVSLNRFFARVKVLQTRFLLLSHDIVNEAAYIAAHHGGHPPGTEFSFYLLSQLSPDLLQIPYAGQSLPMAYVPPVGTTQESKIMPQMLEPAFFSEELIKEKLRVSGFAPSDFLPGRLQHAFGKLYRHCHSYRVAPRLIRVMSLGDISTERKRRISMDFASVASLTPEELFGSL